MINTYFTNYFYFHDGIIIGWIHYESDIVKSDILSVAKAAIERTNEYLASKSQMYMIKDLIYNPDIAPEKEQDIILKHMWPVTFFKFPKYKESYVITITDKLSSLKSFYEYYQSHLMKKKFLRYAYIFFAFTIFKIRI